MSCLEITRKIKLARTVDAGTLRDALVERLQRNIEVESISDGVHMFRIAGTTGAPDSVTRHARLDLEVKILQEPKVARFLISGYARMSKSLIALYGFAILAILLVGLLPGSIETGEVSGPEDAFVFLFIGAYVVYDIHRKLNEPRQFLSSVLESIDSEYGE